jgi:hypothetical protein
VDGTPNLAFFPAGLKVGCDGLPIRLHVGNVGFGHHHISLKHSHWYKRVGKEIPDLIYEKLQQAGYIYSTEIEGKLKISLRIAPETLILLELRHSEQESYFSIVTAYSHPSRIDGEGLGRYRPFV